MTEIGNNEKVVFFDFDNISTFNEILIRTKERMEELKRLGFSKKDSIIIVFENSRFKNSFLDINDFYRLKKIITSPNILYIA